MSTKKVATFFRFVSTCIALFRYTGAAGISITVTTNIPPFVLPPLNSSLRADLFHIIPVYTLDYYTPLFHRVPHGVLDIISIWISAI